MMTKILVKQGVWVDSRISLVSRIDYEMAIE